MKKNLVFCVLFLVTICNGDGYGQRPRGILGGLLSGAKDVLEEISKGGLSIQGQFQGNLQQGGGFNKPQAHNNYAGNNPQNPVETIIVVVEESPEQNQYANNGQYGNGYGYVPQNFNNNHQNRPGNNNYGGNYNNKPWNNGYGHHPSHHRPGFGHNPHYQGNYVPNNPPNNNNFNQNPFGNNPNNQPNRPFDRPFDNNNGNTNQNPYENHPTNNNRPNRPFDKPVNTALDNIPTELPKRPFDKPFDDQGSLPGIPTSVPGQGERENENKPSTENIQKPVVTTTPEGSLHNVDKTTKGPKDDEPLFVPLNPNQYVYGGDKIEINAPKREANENPMKAEDDYSDSNIDPLDVRIGENAS